MNIDCRWLIETTIAAIGAGATIAIAVVAHRFSKRHTTLQAVDQLSSIVGALDRRLSTELSPNQELTPDLVQNILNSPSVADVIEFLNAYESLAAAVASRVLDPRLARSLRGEALVGTYNRFLPFIEAWRRDRRRPNAWQQLGHLAERWRAA